MRRSLIIISCLLVLSSAFALQKSNELLAKAGSIDLSDKTQDIMSQIQAEGVLEGGILKFNFTENEMNYEAELAAIELDEELTEGNYLEALRFFYSAGYSRENEGYYNNMSFTELSAGDKALLLAFKPGLLLRFSYISEGGMEKSFANEVLLTTSETVNVTAREAEGDEDGVSDMNWLWGIIIGIVIGAIAVVIVLRLKKPAKKKRKKKE